MQQEEKSIWDVHNEKKAALQKEWLETSLAFTKNRAALAASYGGQIPHELQKELAQKEATTFKGLNKRIREEENRFMDQIENYDLSRNLIPQRNITTHQKESGQERPPSRASRFIDALPSSKQAPSPAPDNSKDKSIDRDER